ncbi:hypothetical protein [Pseudoalteromonas sp. T1lg75]|nr:hypothetical protein [Pseudoalteromonas sp. T1lg75]
MQGQVLLPEELEYIMALFREHDSGTEEGVSASIKLESQDEA